MGRDAEGGGTCKPRYPPPLRGTSTGAPFHWLLAAIVATLWELPAIARQSDLDAALEAWRAAHGDLWELEVDPTVGFGVYLYGGLADPETRPEDEAGFVEAAMGFVQASEALHGIDPETLAFERRVFLPLSLIDSSDKITVRFLQQVDGVPVEGGCVNVLMDAADDYLLSVQSTGLPGLETFDTTPSVPAAAASVLASGRFLSDTGFHAEETSAPRLVIAQIEDETSRTPRLAWFVQASAWREGERLPPVSFYYWFDARSGELVRTRDAVKHYDVSGTVVSYVTTGTGGLHEDGDFEVKPMSRIAIFDANDEMITYAADDGTFTIPGTAPLTIKVRYEGEVTAQIENEPPNGAEREETHTLQNPTGNIVTMNDSPDEEVTAQANAYYWITRVHDWIAATNPYDTVWNSFGTDLPFAKVNDSGLQCNGGVSNHWLRLSPSDTSSCGDEDHWSRCMQAALCTNTASATIIVHELSHLLFPKYGGFATLTFEEGMADVYALYVTDQEIYAKDLCLDVEYPCGDRRGDNALRYCLYGPEGCHGDTHLSGQVLSGALWKMRQRLKQS